MNNFFDSIALRVDVSKNIGIGHLIRLTNFVKFLKISKKKLFWFIKGDKTMANKILKKNNLKNIFFLKERGKYKILNTIKKKNINLIIFDISHKSNLIGNKLNNYINFFKKNDLKIVSFDHPHKKTNSDLSIMPYTFKNYKNTKNNLKIKGHKYFIFPKEFEQTSKLKKKIKKNPENIIISLGGTDPKNVIANILNQILSSNLNFKVKILYGFNKKALLGNFNNMQNIKFVNYQNQIHKLLFWADLAIINEGNIKFETGALGIPSIMINTVERDNSILIKDFLKFRTVKYIPFNLINVNFKKIFLRYYKDTSLRKFHSLNGKKYFDFKGPSRIIKKLKILNEI